jgi:hypothetical protein
MTDTTLPRAPEPSTGDGNGRGHHRAADAAPSRDGHEPLFGVRTADLEPYVGLRYLSKLFRFIALMLVLLLVAEVATGLAREGTGALPTLVAEVSRLIVLAGLLWGIGDLVLLLIDVGHDVRAARILLGRQAAHQHLHEAAPTRPIRQQTLADAALGEARPPGS